MDTWSSFRSFVIVYGHLVCIVRGNLVYFSRFGVLYQEKSGNPGSTKVRRFYNMTVDIVEFRSRRKNVAPPEMGVPGCPPS
jgi:hypothetical protein